MKVIWYDKSSSNRKWIVGNKETKEWRIVNDNNDDILNNGWGYWIKRPKLVVFNPDKVYYFGTHNFDKNKWLDRLSKEDFFNEESKKNFLKLADMVVK